MATASPTIPTRRARSRIGLLSVAVIVIGVVAVGIWAMTRPQPGTAHEPATSTPTVVIRATSEYDFASVGDMVAASDLVVRAHVVETVRGRPVGSAGADPTGAGIVSRVVTLEIDDALVGGAASGAQVMVEEEGWLDDGRSIAVDGAKPTAVGDRGVWFLQSIPDPDLPGFIVVNSQGRYLEERGGLVGANRSDPFVMQVEALGIKGLVAEVRAVKP